MADTMKVSFEFTLHDVVDGMERTTGRSAVVASWRSRQLAATCAFAFALSFLIKSGPLMTRLLWAIGMSLIAAVLHRFSAVKSRKRQVRKLFLAKFGGVGPFTCEVEVGPTGLVTNQVGTQTRRDWSSVRSVEDTGDAIEFVMQGIGEVVVRNRAFQTKDEWRQFLDLSRNYVTLAKIRSEKPAIAKSA